MKIVTERLEFRVMELEDTVSLMTSIFGSLTEMVGLLNKTVQAQAEMLSALFVSALDSGARSQDDLKDSQ